MYDVFISYHPADRQWVWEWLIPRLKAEGIRICTERETFDVGVPRVKNIENALTASHHILLVLTPDWIRDDWNNFEGLLIQHMDLMGQRQRLLPVLHRPCSLPLRFEVLTLADLSGDDVETQYDKLLAALQGKHYLSDLDAYGTPTLAPPPPVAPATLRQVALGFRYNPFAFPMAEHMPPEILEQTFVFHIGFAEHIMDLDRSAVLLAPPGGGKTASRRLMEIHLERCQARAWAGDFSGPSAAALIVVYNDFKDIAEHMPRIRLNHHAGPLLAAIAEAVYAHIVAHSDSFMALREESRDWWWSFLETYLTGELLNARLAEYRHLIADYRERLTARQPVFSPRSSIRTVFTAILRHLRGLKLDRLFILVDEMDSYLETRSSARLKALARPLLNTLSLFSLPGVIWKFFLPAELEQAVQSSSGYQTGRLHPVLIPWHRSPLMPGSAQDLALLLRQRLAWASEGKISYIDELGGLELTRSVRVEDELVAMALRHRRLGPPRALLELGSQLLEVMQGQQLSVDEWKAFEQRIRPDLRP